MNSDELYQLKVNEVLLAQYKRVNSNIKHQQVCSCEFCVIERSLRDELNSFSQHKREQANFIYLCKDFLDLI